ncbi:Pfs, NACHT and ankyrin domain protein [Apodospora peruviana]|uniref:Pfs, NACHT and ankyrin domain protein n=1 Tax=Apodospora peruviana TaxID=516989 RepID=A0AAE0M4W6_9PEZI|nr:Pfs, NACHT and ankyrin domain protein [Apodospora peruviana]
MLFDLLPHIQSQLEPQLGHRAVACALLLLIATAFWLRYTAQRHAYLQFRADQLDQTTQTSGSLRPQTNKSGFKAPPTFPYVFPFLGSLPLGYLWGPGSFVLNPNNFFQSPHPVRVKILHQEVYIVQGARNLNRLFIESVWCTAIPFVKYALGRAFGLPAKALRVYDNDDSGGLAAPLPGSKVRPEQRIDYLTHKSLVTFLEGPGLSPLWHRVERATLQTTAALKKQIGPDWEHRADLMEFVGTPSATAFLNSLCGPYLLQLNPTFVRDYWDFDRNLQTYLQGIPRLFAPKAYGVQKRVLAAVKAWHQHARDNYTPSGAHDNSDDPYWGSRFFRDRQDMFDKMDGFDHDAVASADFGFIWAARNSIGASSWALLEIYKDPDLLARVRAEVDAAALQVDEGIAFDLDQLLRSPWLQAVYAEILRLRMHFFVVRMGDRRDLSIQDWIIPKHKVVVALTTAAHMDTAVWQHEDQPPVDQFWPARFLTGPAQNVFSVKAYGDAWMPYGGGPRICPGRHLAKRQILYTVACMVHDFDIDMMDGGKHVKEDLSLWGFGNGISHPAGKVPMRIRRRPNPPPGRVVEKKNAAS